MLETFHEHLGRRGAAVKVNGYEVEPNTDLSEADLRSVNVRVDPADQLKMEAP